MLVGVRTPSAHSALSHGAPLAHFVVKGRAITRRSTMSKSACVGARANKESPPKSHNPKQEWAWMALEANLLQ